MVLLRSMAGMLNIEQASQITAGLEQDGVRSDPELQSVLTFAHEPICMITGVLRSPDIEHLAQCFATLFVRIGLVDHQDQTIEQHEIIARG